MAFRRSIVGSAISAPPHASGAATRPPPPPSAPLFTQAQRMVALLVFLLSISGVYSVEDPSVGSCRYDLTSVAALSCLLPSGALQPPSVTCCKSLLYAVDHYPSSGLSGACCLCRYIREIKLPSYELAATYILCEGKDRDVIKKWTSFPLKICSIYCRRTGNSSPNPLEHSPKKGKDKDTFHVLWLWFQVVTVLLIGLACFRCIWIKLAASYQGQKLSLHGSRKVDPRRSPSRSSTKRKGRK